MQPATRVKDKLMSFPGLGLNVHVTETRVSSRGDVKLHIAAKSGRDE
jgi:hypothetical protein